MTDQDPPDQADDVTKLTDLARGLPRTDLDAEAADRIAAIARRDVGHGPPRRPLIEAVLVGMLVVATLGWVSIQICAMLAR